MKFRAEIDIMPMEELLDPQGKVIQSNLDKLGVNGVGKVRIGKHVKMELEAENENLAHEAVDNACKKLLANMIMERYVFTLEEVE